LLAVKNHFGFTTAVNIHKTITDQLLVINIIICYQYHFGAACCLIHTLKKGNLNRLIGIQRKNHAGIKFI
jgi:hypothetical protein